MTSVMHPYYVSVLYIRNTDEFRNSSVLRIRNLSVSYFRNTDEFRNSSVLRIRNLSVSYFRNTDELRYSSVLRVRNLSVSYFRSTDEYVIHPYYGSVIRYYISDNKHPWRMCVSPSTLVVLAPSHLILSSSTYKQWPYQQKRHCLCLFACVAYVRNLKTPW